MVVGATGGLGLETALQLAQHGADQVIVTGRTEDKANAGVKQIQMQTGRQEGVESLVLNLSDLKETKAAAETFLGSGKHLDILVLNAGMLNHIYQKTPHDQLEEHIAVNIALHLFTTTILPALNRGAHIVMVSSWGHNDLKTPLFDDRIHDEAEAAVLLPRWVDRYGNSTLAKVLFAQALQKRLGTDFYVNACHPGAIRTGLARHVSTMPYMGWVLRLSMQLMAFSMQQGVLTQLYLATSPEVEQRTIQGQYFHAIARLSPDTVSPLTKGEDGARLEEQLWTWTEDTIRQKLQ